MQRLYGPRRQIMIVYLVQHGAAKSKEEDSERPLTDVGRQDAERVARAAASLGLNIDTIYHSGKTRAEQTAQIFAEHLKPSSGVAHGDHLAPMDHPAPATELANKATKPIMLVGHLPHLSRLASLLLVDDSSKEIVAFRMGGLACLDNVEGSWSLRWMLTPDVVP